ncbi:solute carrier organic anion transporter family member 2B1-like [Watersipora subatra]|uniref:solute carrier organic anion transporter family member 2B1-like n=1 Tax=Watersipora subatra TaxID=2589382 RepID=UPI00355C470D
MAVINDRCGFGPLKRNANLQKCANLWLYSIILGLVVFGVSGCYSYMSAVLSTSQTVFSLSSQDVGVWYSMFEIGSILSNLIASYFFTNKNVPNVLSCGLTVVIVGAFTHAIPHFLLNYEEKIQSTKEVDANFYIAENLCDSLRANISWNTTGDETTVTASNYGDSTFSKTVLTVYCIAGFLMGVGYAPFWCLGLAYVDNNVKKSHETAKFLGIILTFYTIGPVIGFGSGGLFLNIYVTLGETYLTSEDEQWIGAYWMGYLVFGAFLILLLPVIFMFPKSLPRKDDNSPGSLSLYNIVKSDLPGLTKTDEGEPELVAQLQPQEAQTNKVNVKDNLRSIKGFLPTFLRLATNPLFIIEVLASCCGVYYISGWLGFLPKYFEETFHYTASNASTYAGAIPPLLSCIGVFAGGYLSSRYKLNTQQSAVFLFVSTLTSTLLLVPLFFLRCDQYPVQQPDFDSVLCASSCGCDENAHVPVCHEQTTYRSPCVIGCENYTASGDELKYARCFCERNITVSVGACQQTDCISSQIFLACAILATTAFVCSSSAGLNIIMRAVAEEDKSLALGVQSSLNSLLAWIPAPILYGMLIDSTCKIWEHPDDPYFKGYCMEYYNEDYANKYVGMTVGAMSLTCFFCGLGVPVSRMKRYIKEETQEVCE